MTESEWRGIKYFRPTENFGDAALMSFELVSELDRFRAMMQRRMVVTSGTQGKHAVGSKHYQGMAVDVVFKDCGLREREVGNELMDYFYCASRFKFTAIGLYPDWRYGSVRCGGLHLEVSPNSHHRELWIGVGEPQKYLPLVHAEVRNLGL